MARFAPNIGLDSLFGSESESDSGSDSGSNSQSNSGSDRGRRDSRDRSSSSESNRSRSRGSGGFFGGVSNAARDAARRIDDSTDIDERVGRATRGVRETAEDVAEDVDESTDIDEQIGRATRNTRRDASAVARDLNNRASRTVGNTRQSARSAAETAQGTVRDIKETGRELSNSANQARRDASQAVEDTMTAAEDFSRAEINRDVSDDLTKSGGVFSEQTEQGIQSAADDINEVKQTIETDEGGVPDEEEGLGEQVLEGAAKTGIDLLNAPQHVQTLETGIEVGTNAPRVIGDRGFRAVGETGVGVARETGKAIVEEARENPGEFAGGTALGIVTGAAAGRVLGRTGRAAKDRLRTAGGSRVDFRDVTSDSVVRNVETRGVEGDSFPGAQDPGLYQTDPATAVRKQAADYSTEDIEKRFSDAGVEEGVVMKKALDVEPTGPKRRRSARGFESAPGESLEDFDYETPGSFVGPELSPNFLRVGGERSMSLRPGLPDFGSKPTGVLVKTDVENPDADTLEEFNREMVDRSGETTARTKPAGEVAVDEIEAVIPPGSKFSDIGGSPTRNLLRKVGVGSDFYTEVSGRRVPLRPVAPSSRGGDSDLKSPADADLSDDPVPDVDLSGTSADGSGRTLDEIVRPIEPEVDRPLPPLTTGASRSSSNFLEEDLSGVYEPGVGSGGSSGPSSPSSRVSEDFLSPSGVSGPPGSSPRSTPGGRSTAPPSSPPSDPPLVITGSSSLPRQTPGGTGAGSPTRPPSSPPNNPPKRPPDLNFDIEADIKRRKSNFDDFEKTFTSSVASEKTVLEGFTTKKQGVVDSS